MNTITKKDLIDSIADQTQQSRSDVKRTVQCFLDNVTLFLSQGKRLELRHFGVFEVRERAPRKAQNPRTMEPIPVPKRKTVRFKIGQLMKDKLESNGVKMTGDSVAPSMMDDGEDESRE